MAGTRPQSRRRTIREMWRLRNIFITNKAPNGTGTRVFFYFIFLLLILQHHFSFAEHYVKILSRFSTPHFMRVKTSSPIANQPWPYHGMPLAWHQPNVPPHWKMIVYSTMGKSLPSSSHNEHQWLTSRLSRCVCADHQLFKTPVWSTPRYITRNDTKHQRDKRRTLMP